LNSIPGRKTPHLPRGTRRAATDEKSRDAVALDRHCNCNAKGIDPSLQKKIERLLGWPERNLSSPWTAEHERRRVDVERLNWKGAT
jgi:hypothetical protein